MSLRTERHRNAQGPLGPEEFSAYLERGYDESTQRFFARVWDVQEDPEVLKEVAEKGFANPIKFQDLSLLAKAIFATIARRGGRLRGEALRRELLLAGFGESEEVLLALIRKGFLVPLPNPGEHDCNIDMLVEHGNFLQRDIAVLESVYTFLAELEGAEELQAPTWTNVTLRRDQGDLQTLEVNLLHITALIRRDPLKLNKDGTPNRRSLGRVARGISMPGQLGEVAGDLDLNDALQVDYLTFLVSLARELQLLTQREQTYRTDDGELTRFFHSDGAERDRRFIDALQRLRFWNEIESARIAALPSRSVDDLHFSQYESTGQPLIGARGFVVSVLRRAHFSDWVSLEALSELCTQLDHQYLERTLSQLPLRPEPREFIQAVLTRTLAWGGILEPGVAEDGTNLVRLSSRGARGLGLELEFPPEPPGGSLIVQPNFEVMVFLDNAPITVLHELYRLGERKKLSDRVATFQLLTESVQRGYSLGGDADSLLSLLEKHGHTPVPESVTFQLRDWERVHRRLTIHLGGAALRHPDPERFDLICGQLEHDLRESDVRLIRLGARDAFVTDATHQAVDRAANSHPSLRIDAIGTPPECLHFVDPLVFMVDPYEWDIPTSVEIAKITQHLEEDSSPRSLFYELDLKKVKKRFPGNTYESLVQFLDPRCPRGLGATQRLRLQAELLQAPTYHLESDLVVITFEQQSTAEDFLELPDAGSLLLRRLGPTTFVVDGKNLALFEEIMDEIKLKELSLPPDFKTH